MLAAFSIKPLILSGALLSVLALAPARGADAPNQPKKEDDPKITQKKEEPKMETITLAAGCFWCVEAVMQRIQGIVSVKSGYIGGKAKNPTYEQVCTGQTGHAEAVEVVYDPSKITTEKVIQLFFELHDPTTLNRQGADSGTQYRSAIFYHTDEQKTIAEAVKKKYDDEHKFKDKIVTEITKADTFYAAEKYHDNYYNRNSQQGYCQIVIAPKLKKLGLETK